MILIDLYVLGELLLFDFIRKPRILAFWSVIALSINGVQTSFQQLFNDTKYDLTFNGQVIYLEHYLNDKYDNTQRRIVIEDIELGNSTFLFNKIEENEDTFIYNKTENEDPIYLNNNTEVMAVNNFQVLVPSDITFDEIVFRRHVDKYRLAGKQYEIIIV